MPDRRKFLKNTTLAAFAAAVLPKSSLAATRPVQDTADCDPTTLDFYGQGPFYTANPPAIDGNKLANDEEPGQRMILTGRVHNLDCTEFIPDTLIDVWHADNEGGYDNEGFNLRGFTYSNAQGFYTFETIYPGKYLNGNAFRPSHIHFRITPPDHPMLITQLYFEGDPDNASDAASSITSGQYDASHRIIPLFVDGDGILSTSDLHLNKGIIYSAGPNPYSDRIEIKYGVFEDAKVSLMVYDINGKEVATLEESNHAAEKYNAVWAPDSWVPAGTYFIALKVNDLQVHYLKVVRQ